MGIEPRVLHNIILVPIKTRECPTCWHVNPLTVKCDVNLQALVWFLICMMYPCREWSRYGGRRSLLRGTGFSWALVASGKVCPWRPLTRMNSILYVRYLVLLTPSLDGSTSISKAWPPVTSLVPWNHQFDAGKTLVLIPKLVDKHRSRWISTTRPCIVNISIYLSIYLSI